MHSNLIKVNEDLAFAKNKEGVISLINKKHDDYSFEDIGKKESEIAILEADIKKINEEYQNEFIEPKESKSAFLKELRSTILVGVPTIALICFIISQGSGLALVFGSIPLIIATDRKIKKCFASYAKMKKYAKNPDDSKEKLTQIKELLNTKKAELEQMLDKVDYREYSKKEEIASILNNMLNITPSKASVNSLRSDISNVQNLNGPSLNRKRD